MQINRFNNSDELRLVSKRKKQAKINEYEKEIDRTCGEGAGPLCTCPEPVEG